MARCSSLIGAGRVLGFDLARAEGSLELTLSPELRYAAGAWESSLSGSMRIPWEVNAGIWPLLFHADDVIPNETGWTFTWDDMLGDVRAEPVGAAPGATRQPGEPHVMPSLSADQDGAGNALILRAMDSDPAPDTADSDIYYTYRPAGGNWTALAPLEDSDRMLTTPAVAMDGQGGALAVWVANDLPTDGSVEPTQSELFRHQDLYGAYFDGSSWSAPARITDDAWADGQPAVACDPATGDGILVWTRSEAEDATDRTGFEIGYATWDHAGQSWSSPALLTSDTVGDWSPQVAFNGSSQALAVWTRDTDGDLPTRELAYAEWNDGWSRVNVCEGWGRASEAAIAPVPSGSFVVACVEEGETREMLWSAFYEPTSHTWDTAEVVASGGIIQDPRVRVNSSGVATVLWQAVSRNGQNDLLAATQDLGAARVWTAPRHLTNDGNIEWMPVLLFDEAGDPYSAYELLRTTGVSASERFAHDTGTPALGDDVRMAQADLVPDLAVQNISVMAFQPIEGSESRLTANVGNVGWAQAPATTVQFYLGDPQAGGSQIGDPVDVPALAVGDSAYLISDPFAVPTGTNDYYAVVTPIPDEAATTNNSTVATLESVPPDTRGPQVALELPPGGVLPERTSALTLRFDEPVVSVGESNVSLVESTQGIIPPNYVYLSTDGMSATLIFEGGLPPAAAPDTYALRVLDSVVDLAGNPLDGDGDGTGGDDYTVSLSVAIPGDSDINGEVKRNDFLVLQEHFGTVGGARWQDGDSNNDGNVNYLDYLAWKANVRKSVSPLPPALPPAQAERQAAPVEHASGTGVPETPAPMVAVRPTHDRLRVALAPPERGRPAVLRVPAAPESVAPPTRRTTGGGLVTTPLGRQAIEVAGDTQASGLGGDLLDVLSLPKLLPLAL